MKQVYALRILVIFLLILMLSAAAVAYFTFSFSQLFYANANALRLDPLGLNVYTSVPTRTAPDVKRAVFFGDSRAASWTPLVNLAGWEFINRGIEGQTTAQILGRFTAHIVPLKPQVIILQLGVNDLQDIPVFPDRRAEIIANCLANIRSIIQQSNDLGAVVVLSTIFPVDEPTFERRLFFWSDDIARAVQEVNLTLRTFASERVLLLDTDPILLDANGSPRTELMLDTLHLNPAGYDALNLRLAQLLSAVSS